LEDKKYDKAIALAESWSVNSSPLFEKLANECIINLENYGYVLIFNITTTTIIIIFYVKYIYIYICINTLIIFIIKVYNNNHIYYM